MGGHAGVPAGWMAIARFVPRRDVGVTGITSPSVCPRWQWVITPAYCWPVVAPGALSSSSAALGDEGDAAFEADARSRYLDEDISWVESGARILALAEDRLAALATAG